MCLDWPAINPVRTGIPGLFPHFRKLFDIFGIFLDFVLIWFDEFRS